MSANDMKAAKARIRVVACPIAFNEESKIGSVVSRFNPEDIDEILVVDDGSTDSTAEVAKNAGANVLSLKERRGVGNAIREATKYARDNNYDVIVVVAGNDKDRPQEIPRLLKPIIEEGCDFVQGSRYLPGGSFGNMPVYRQLSTRYLHPMLLSMATGKRITDSSNGFRAFRLSILDHPKVDIDQVWLDAYELEVYLYYKVITLGLKFREVPVTKIYPEHSLGYTKMQPITGWWKMLRPIFFLRLGFKK
ncbi:MAG: glycosyltransferase family 2 protein [Kiritimatiellia bacterium]|nr:glycosyltransferase family 2 protein [Kiritimatiellia bacterium]